ncbi:GH25 family lysozyme [Arthrobacter sp. MP_M7]|uniref:GH25 family lysozyme n=1 Tax=Arthrobacter sp. MP_M7 TaxID=3071716 RepID=UPI002E0F5AB5
MGATLLAACLLAGSGLAAPAGAVEPTPGASATPASTVPALATTSPGLPASAPAAPPPSTPTAAKQVPATAASPAVSTDRSSAAYRTAMAAATVAGGAEMGQGSSAAGTGASATLRTTTEALTAESTWMPRFGIQGLDVSYYQAGVNWQQQWNMGARFAYIKATEGNYYSNAIFGAQYRGARDVGMIRGAYHYANPAASSGADQARIFVKGGGGWTADGYTLPPVLDFEGNPYAGQTIGGYYQGNTCYDMSPAQLTTWARDFGRTMQALTGRLPMLYTTTSWWSNCVGDPSGFGDWPLWIARFPGSQSESPGALPSSWDTFSVWQYSEKGPFADGGDSNVWNGNYAGLSAFARNSVSSAASLAIAELASATTQLGAATSGVSCGLRNGGCFQLFGNGAVIWSAGTGAQASLYGPVRDAWARTGFENGPLGYPTSALICGIRDQGCFQAYENGEILYSAASGAQPSTAGAIRTAYRKAGAENSALGYPTSGEVCGLRNSGCYQSYQRGEILWSQATGAQLSEEGPVRTAYRKAGAENSALGFPTSGKICGLPQTGCYQGFQAGAIIQTAATGAQLSPNGPIRTAWANSGFEGGPLGYPTGETTCGLVNDGCYQPYQKGAILWSPATGAQLSLNGPIRTAWAGTRYETGPLGYPTSAVTCGLVNGGCYQAYQHGEILYSTASGAKPTTTGAIRTLYRNNAAENGLLGYPTSAEVCSLVNSGCYQNYQKGAIIWSPATGAQLSPNGPIRNAWAATRYETGTLAYPTTGVVCGLVKSGCYQNYQGGAIIWSPTTGARISPNGPIRTLWQQTGFETGRLGYPTGAQTCNTTKTTCTQPFTGGKITWTTTRGAYIN